MKRIMFLLFACTIIGSGQSVTFQIQSEHPFHFTGEAVVVSALLRNNGTNMIPVFTFPPDVRRGQVFFSDPTSNFSDLYAQKKMSKEYDLIRMNIAEPEDIIMVGSNQTRRVVLDYATLNFNSTGTFHKVANLYLGNGKWVVSNTLTFRIVSAEDNFSFKTLVPDIDPYDISFHVLKYQGTNYLIKSRQNLRVAEFPAGKPFDINWDNLQRYAIVTVEGQTNTIYDVRMLKQIWPPVTIP